ncbi:hypothetical protein Tco_0001963 [Tanacetum coccineum]
MAQPQRQTDVHQDELCPPNKRYALMDANKKIDLDNLLCPNESKILANILKNHPLRFSIVASSSVPWIYLGKFWHTLKEDGSKYRIKLEPKSNKESLEVEITTEVQPLNTIEEEDESAKDDYKLKRMEKGNEELTINDPPPSSSTPSSSSSKPKLSASQHILSLFKPKTGRFKRYKSLFDELQGRYGYLFEHLKTMFRPRKKFYVLAQHLQEVMEESLPKMNQTNVAKMIANAIKQNHENLQAEITSQINNAITNHIPSQVDSSVRKYMSGYILHDDLPIWLALKYKFERLHVSNTPCRPFAVLPRDQDDHHDDAYLEGENSEKRQKTSEHGTYVFKESSSDSYATNDDELPTEKVSQELMEEISQTVDEAKLHKVNDIVWESRKEILVSPYLQKPTPVIQSFQRDPKAPALSLVNQYLLYLKKGNSGPEKIVMSQHKFLAIIFPDDDIEERTSRWVDKYVKKFNPYARYSVEHWKNPHAKIFYIKKQKKHEKPKEVVYSNSKIVQIIKNYWKLGHEHKFITEIIARRENGSIVDDYAETGLLWSLSVFIRSIKKYKVFSIVFEPVYGIIYKNNKKEKRVMRHQEIYKFYDATLKRVLEGLKSYNNNVKHGYMTPSLNKEDDEYLQLFEEEIEERLKHRDQMRH